MNVSTKLDWNDTEFNLLGLHFSVQLNNMPDINYKKAFTKAMSVMNKWSNRYLTPIGKITVIKTLVLPIFNHLFTCIPAPKPILDNINKALFKFLWDGKPDKIKRETVYKQNKLGGLNMVNIHTFVKAIQLNWIKKIIKQNHESSPLWYQLLLMSVGNLDKLVTRGAENGVKQ